MTLLEDRERAFESKFAHDQDRRALALARRNHLFGQWAAEKMHLSPDRSSAYAEQIVRLGLSRPEPECLKDQVRRDLEEAGLFIAPAEIDQTFATALACAEKQLQAEALTTPEHTPVQA